jgi:hypothetical protein
LLAIEISLELALGILGSVTGVISFLIYVWTTLQAKPKLKIGDTMLFLERDEKNEVRGRLSFNVNNIGERATTVVRINVILGDHVEVIEGLRDVEPHCSIRYPEKAGGEVKLYTGFKEIETLRISVIYTQGTIGIERKLPQIHEWDKHALWKGGPIVLEP